MDWIPIDEKKIEEAQLVLKFDAKNQISLPADHYQQLSDSVRLAGLNLNNSTTNKLSQILKQIKFLQEEAKTIISHHTQSDRLNKIKCNFQKIPGRLYHLYQRKSDNVEFLSMLSVQEWGGFTDDLIYHGSFKYERDGNWIEENRVYQDEKEKHQIEVMLDQIFNFNAIKDKD